MKAPSLDYPLYVLQTGGENYFAVHGKNSKDGSPAAAIAIGSFTTVLDTLPEGFYWDCPLFVIHLGDGNYGASYAVAQGRGKLLAVPVFTDQDLAQRFMEATGMVGEIQTLDEIRAVVEFVRAQKVAVVTFDLWKMPAGRITSKHSLDAAEILRRLG